VTTEFLDASSLRSVIVVFRDALIEHREEINNLNVYPVPDGDTGTNMSLTLRSVVEDLEKGGDDLGSVCEAIAHGSLMGARGNSGVIMSQILRGFVGVVSNKPVIDGLVFAQALAAAAEGAYGAVGNPVEGTILTVVRESSEAAMLAASSGADLLGVLEAANLEGEASLLRTPELLQVLADAGVVDAGGSGFMLFLSAALNVIGGRPIPEPKEIAPPMESVRPTGDQHGGSIADLKYEVMFFLDAVDDSITGFKAAWAKVGDSIVVVGGDGIWNCHIHTDDIGAAIEAGIAVGRPHEIRVTDLLEELEERDWVTAEIGSVPDAAAGEPVPTAVVAVGVGSGVVAGRYGRAVDESVHGRPGRRGRIGSGSRGGDPTQQQKHHSGGRAGRCAIEPHRPRGAHSWHRRGYGIVDGLRPADVGREECQRHDTGCRRSRGR